MWRQVRSQKIRSSSKPCMMANDLHHQVPLQAKDQMKDQHLRTTYQWNIWSHLLISLKHLKVLWLGFCFNMSVCTYTVSPSHHLVKDSSEHLGLLGLSWGSYILRMGDVNMFGRFVLGMASSSSSKYINIFINFFFLEEIYLMWIYIWWWDLNWFLIKLV